MTLGIWITIATTISQILATVGIGYWQVKVARQIANPEKKEDKPKNKESRIKYSRKAITFCLFSIVFSLININSFFILPPTKLTIFILCFSLASIVFAILSYLLINISEHTLVASNAIWQD